MSDMKQHSTTATARRIGTCTRDAAVLIEGRATIDGGLAYGPIRTEVYACEAHARAARTEWIQRPLTAFTALAEPTTGHRCGEALDRDSLSTPPAAAAE
ncbi:hypothetical protein OG542_40325 (plasmid) [Streptomyces violaceus]|uniref:hypothetical protein n=1 Tax=Streptomyces violaceus TaxID=1936 RepID=UPI002E1BF906